MLSNELKISSSEVKVSKKNAKILLKGNVEAIDKQNNILKVMKRNISKDKDLLNSFGLTTVITKEKFIFKSKNVFLIIKIKL